MLSAKEASETIQSKARPMPPEPVALQQSLGRVLAEDLLADRDFPPFDRVTMDGIAFRFENFAAGQRIFPIENVQAAGAPRQFLKNPAACIEVMTGAMLPGACDTVVRYEDLKIENGTTAEVLVSDLKFQQNIHFQGIDRRAGDLLVPRGRRIRAAEIATAATIGKSILQVAKLPRTAIVSTGDELVEVHARPLPYQIRRSNVFALQALLLEKCGLPSETFHFNDDRKALAAGLRRLLQNFEIVLLSGAVSEGKFDFVPAVMADLGVEKCFHKVAQRPGKPFWFGQWAGQTAVFALPGNPVSSFLCCCRYVLPFLEKMSGATERPPATAVLAEKITFKPSLSYFLPVKLDASADGILRARPLPGHGSGDLANLNDTDAFLELPGQTRDLFEAGEAFPLVRF